MSNANTLKDKINRIKTPEEKASASLKLTVTKRKSAAQLFLSADLSFIHEMCPLTKTFPFIVLWLCFFQNYQENKAFCETGGFFLEEGCIPPAFTIWHERKWYALFYFLYFWLYMAFLVSHDQIKLRLWTYRILRFNLLLNETLRLLLSITSLLLWFVLSLIFSELLLLKVLAATANYDMPAHIEK